MWDHSSQTRGRTRVPCIGRQILYHWTTREVPNFFLYCSGSQPEMIPPQPPKQKSGGTVSGDILVVTTGFVTGIYRVEARDAAKHPTIHGTVPVTKTYLA